MCKLPLQKRVKGPSRLTGVLRWVFSTKVYGADDAWQRSEQKQRCVLPWAAHLVAEAVCSIPVGGARWPATANELHLLIDTALHAPYTVYAYYRDWKRRAPLHICMKERSIRVVLYEVTLPGLSPLQTRRSKNGRFHTVLNRVVLLWYVQLVQVLVAVSSD